MSKKSKAEKEKFSLKDQLFNKVNVNALARRISNVYPTFNSSGFVKDTLKNFSRLELKERIVRITESLETYLPQDYLKSLKIIIKSLPAACDSTNTDDDFGDFIYEPFNLYIARNGNNKKFLHASLAALEQTTQRFSAEFALRYFVTSFEKETIGAVKKWTKNPHYHVRRLASEGIRPNLPWGGKIKLEPKIIISILDQLYSDSTRYVTRSVANNLNDISKNDPALVLATLKRWRKEKKQDKKELEYIEKHALRTQIKLGNPEVLSFLGFNSKGRWKIKKMSLPSTVKIGSELKFSCQIEFEQPACYLVDYILYFASKKGVVRKKVFKAAKISASSSAFILIQKTHLLKDMSTRKIFPGIHKIEFQINGQRSETFEFRVLA